MEKVIKYRFFSSSEDFEKFQKTTEDIKIINITPVPNEALEADKEEYNLKISFGVFVTYWGLSDETDSDT